MAKFPWLFGSRTNNSLMNFHGRNWLPSDRADADDIRYCFRILLGREPSAEEVPGHFSRVGEPLASVVAGYLGSLEFQRRGLSTARVTPALELVRFDNFSIWADRDDLDVGAHLRDDTYEPHVTAKIKSFLKPGMTFVDVGANIGYYTMLGAALVGDAGKVIAVEPNQSNVKMIEASRRENAFQHVRIIQCAAGSEHGILALYAAHSNGMTETVPEALTSLFTCTTVAQFELDSVLNNLARLDLIKIDVEGREFDALLGAAQIIDRFRPTIISEFAPTMMQGTYGTKGIDYLSWLIRKGYVLEVVGGHILPASDPSVIMENFAASGCDHIDVLATPALRS